MKLHERQYRSCNASRECKKMCFSKNSIKNYSEIFLPSSWRIWHSTEPCLSSLPGQTSQFLDVVSPHSPDSPHCNTEVSSSLGLDSTLTPSQPATESSHGDSPWFSMASVRYLMRWRDGRNRYIFLLGSLISSQKGKAWWCDVDQTQTCWILNRKDKDKYILDWKNIWRWKHLSVMMWPLRLKVILHSR